MTDKRGRAEFLKRLNTVFCDVFEDDDIVITEETTAEDIEEWDSLMHITLVISAEQEFGMRMRASEVGKMANVGAFLDILIVRAAR